MAGCLRCAPTVRSWQTSILNPLDHLMSKLGHQMVRYADNMVILCPSAEAAQGVLTTIREWTTEAGLTLHPGKTKIVDMGPPKSYFDFLGYRFWRSQKGGHLRRFIRPESVQKFKAGIKPLTKRANGRSLEAIAKLLRPKLAGFHRYFSWSYPRWKSRIAMNAYRNESSAFSSAMAVCFPSETGSQNLCCLFHQFAQFLRAHSGSGGILGKIWIYSGIARLGEGVRDRFVAPGRAGALSPRDRPVHIRAGKSSSQSLRRHVGDPGRFQPGGGIFRSHFRPLV